MGLIYKLTFLFHAVLTNTSVSLSFGNLATCVKLGGLEWNQRWPTQTRFTILKTDILRAVAVTNLKRRVSNNAIYEILSWSYKILNFLYIMVCLDLYKPTTWQEVLLEKLTVALLGETPILWHLPVLWLFTKPTTNPRATGIWSTSSIPASHLHLGLQFSKENCVHAVLSYVRCMPNPMHSEKHE